MKDAIITLDYENLDRKSKWAEVFKHVDAFPADDWKVELKDGMVLMGTDFRIASDGSTGLNIKGEHISFSESEIAKIHWLG